ncbi:MAG: ribosomal RNA small subunit methyltransferase A [Bacteroidia bacterium]|nr:ribosomal RNA small subunit methyltransferase A [Bacteroidia bacterium]
MKFTDQGAFFAQVKAMKMLATKDLGQNFLVNPDLSQKIVELLEIDTGESVLEIGAGFGSLSYFLALSNGIISLLDVDPKTIAFLTEQFGDHNNIMVIQESILKHDVSNYEKIIGNLPYYITSDTIAYVLLNGYHAKRMVFMIQKEVLPRLAAHAGEEGYGPLSILISYLGRVKRNFLVSRNQFAPAPNVDSVVVTIEINQENDYETAKTLFRLTMDLFHHRRKTIRNNLRIMLKDATNADHMLDMLGIDGSKRPEELPLEAYLSLIKQLKF